MAYTKIIKVKSNLNLCLDYTSNPKKTERRSAEDLNRLLSYTQSNDKTEHQLYPKTSFPFGKVAIKNIFMSKSVDQHIHA